MPNIMSAINCVTEPVDINGYYRVCASVNGINYDEQLGIQINDKSIKSNNKFIVAYTVGSHGGIQANIGAVLELDRSKTGAIGVCFISTNFPFSFDAINAASLAYISNNVLADSKLPGKFIPNNGVIKYVFCINLGGDTISSDDAITQSFKVILHRCLLSSSVITGFLTDQVALKYPFKFYKNDILKIEDLMR